MVSVQLNLDVRICETVSIETCGASLHLLTWGHAIYVSHSLNSATGLYSDLIEDYYEGY